MTNKADKTAYKRIAVFLLVLVMVLSLGACGDKDTQESQITADAADWDENTVNSDFRALFDNAVECARVDDRAAFGTLFTETDESVIDSDFEIFGEIKRRHYPDLETYVIWGDGDVFMIGTLYSKCDGEYPKENAEWIYKYFFVSYVSDEINQVTEETEGVTAEGEEAAVPRQMKFINNNSESVRNIAGAANQIAYPAEAIDANSSGRNYAKSSSGDFSFIRDDKTIRGTVDSRLFLAWQNEDGSVSLLYCIRNGLDVPLTVNDVTLRLEDEVLGIVCQTVVNEEGLEIGPHKSYKNTVTVSAEEVLTGAVQWEAPILSCEI